MIRIAVVDGRGDGAGRQPVEGMKRRPQAPMSALSANSAAERMRKAGSNEGAAGENVTVYCHARAALLTGGAAVLMADSLLGEPVPCDGRSHWGGQRS